MAEAQTTMLSVESPKSGPTLRACQSCATSKSKCVPATDETEGKCLRCFKSKRECVFQLKSTKKRKSPSSTTAELEQKVQTLAALLASQQSAAAQQRTLPPTPESFTSINAGSANIEPRLNSEPRHRQILPSRTEEPWRTQTPVTVRPEEPWRTQTPVAARPISEPQPRPPVLPDIRSTPNNVSTILPSIDASVSPPEGQYLLRIYRDHFSRRFPFISVPHSVPARDLQAQRPWLYRAITVVASQDNRVQQLAWGREFITDLSVAVVARGERSLDMLQGLLIYNAWSYSYAHLHQNITSTGHHQLAMTLVFDLALNRAPVDNEAPVGLGMNSRSCANSTINHAKPELAISMDEKRTLLSVYFTSNMMAWTMKKIEGLQYSPFIDECCRDVLNKPEGESDLILVALVNLQAIIDKFERKCLDCNYPGGQKTPVWLLSEVAKLELQVYWSSLATELRQNSLLLINYHAALTFIDEPCLVKSHYPRDLAGGNIHRLSMLQDCYASTRQLLDYLLSLPIAEYFTFSALEVFSLGQAYTLLLKLSMVEEKGWDLDQFQNDPTYREYFRRLRQNMQQVGTAIDQNQPRPCQPSFFSACATKMDKVKVWYDARLATSQSASKTTDRSRDMAILNPPEGMEIFDDRFWEDFMLGGSFF